MRLPPGLLGANQKEQIRIMPGHDSGGAPIDVVRPRFRPELVDSRRVTSCGSYSVHEAGTSIETPFQADRLTAENPPRESRRNPWNGKS